MRSIARAFMLTALMAAPQMSAAAETFVTEKVFVDTLRILLTPFPTAVVFGNYPSACVTPAGRPVVVQSGNNVDIRLSAHRPSGAICTAVLAPFVEAVSLANIMDPAAHTYSVNGVAIVPEVESTGSRVR
jgi:hypothetical protein